MLDFLMIASRSNKRGIEIYPKFIVGATSDLMIRGGDFYAIWNEETKLWCTDEQTAIRMIDHELDLYFKENENRFDENVKVLHMWDSETGMIDKWHHYCQKQLRDNFHSLDEKIIFSNVQTCKEDYASKKLSYPLEEGPTPSYDSLMSVLYSDEERRKIEWAIGSIVSGDSKEIQKFFVLYGASGTGKSTVLNIIEMLFDGYYATFNAQALGSSNNSFALEPFRTNPLVAIEQDSDLSRIEDNTRLNSLVSHEIMTVNEKFKAAYSNRFKCLLFVGTNRPVKITDAKSGLLRRLIDISPTGNKLPQSEYFSLYRKVKFELGPIAYHCLQVYKENTDIYNNYIPEKMLGETNDFYDFVVDSFDVFKKEDGITLNAAWDKYQKYCIDAKVPYPLTRRIFKIELKNYFKNFYERKTMDDGERVRSYYEGFKRLNENDIVHVEDASNDLPEWLRLGEYQSQFEELCADCPAQYATDYNGKKDVPKNAWSDVRTKLRMLDTSKVHYVNLPEVHVVVDFDKKNERGEKDKELNLKAASSFPPTYAELSKGGQGLHLHYIWKGGDPKDLSSVYDDEIEIKVFSGNQSLRRKLSACNNLPVAEISSGLPLKVIKGGNDMVNTEVIKSEKGLRKLIKRNLNKEILPSTASSVDFINKILNEAYERDVNYDVSDMKKDILTFAANSTHQSQKCIAQALTMHYVGRPNEKDISQGFPENEDYQEGPIVIFDCEVLPNLFLVCWKAAGEDKPFVRMFNPSVKEMEKFIFTGNKRIVGYNCRRYDNHMLYAAYLGYTNKQIFDLSQSIIIDGKGFFGNAYNISYTDVYDFCSKKQSLKKWEIELGIHHHELGLPWDKPVDESRWEEVARYCEDDVRATEAVWNARQEDFVVRKSLVDVVNVLGETSATVNDTTNMLTTKIIFGRERHPQSMFNYRNLGEIPTDSGYFTHEDAEAVIEGEELINKPVIAEDDIPVFVGYSFENGKSFYRGEDPKEGGYVYSEPGMYGNVALLDVESMHPTSVICEKLFGPYTENFKDILEARLAIKHKDYDTAKKKLKGVLEKYLNDASSAKQLAKSLKIVINSVYGLTSAKFDNPFRDIRNRDNIVAKRGALFMIDLKNYVQSLGYTVAHIKTDSIKIPDATPEIISFVMNYGKMYGYEFEHEATYEKMCLVNDAVYIAKYDEEHGGKWTATGTQFAVPYVFKTLFSKEPIEFSDMCETKSVQTALYLDFNEDLPEGEHDRRFVGKVGLFCPMQNGCGGGELQREGTNKDGSKKYDSATGCKGWRWMEAEMVKNLGKENYINKGYYTKLVDEAVKTISKYGDVERFVD